MHYAVFHGSMEVLVTVHTGLHVHVKVMIACSLMSNHVLLGYSCNKLCALSSFSMLQVTQNWAETGNKAIN